MSDDRERRAGGSLSYLKAVSRALPGHTIHTIPGHKDVTRCVLDDKPLLSDEDLDRVAREVFGERGRWRRHTRPDGTCTVTVRGH